MLINKLFKLMKRLIFTFYVKIKAKNYKKVIANRFTIVNKNTVLGKNVNFNGLVIYGNGNVTIGDNFHSGRDIVIFTRFHNYNGKKIPYDETYLLKDVVIEDNVWIGGRVSIVGNVRIGEGSIIQAGSVVVKDVPKLSIVGGNPARVFKKRDEKHYYNLKNQNLFH